MPEIVSVSRVEMPFRISQNELKTFAREIFSESYPDIDRILESFDNTLIEYRNMQCRYHISKTINHSEKK